MKKLMVLLGLMLLISACSNDREVVFNVDQKAPQSSCMCARAPVVQKPCNVQKSFAKPCPCVAKKVKAAPDLCAKSDVVQTKCAQAEVKTCTCVCPQEPCREVLRPRLEETIVSKSHRHCPPDSQSLNCGCGQCHTFRNQPEPKESIRSITPAAPDAYVLASNRVFNRFIKDTYDLYSQKPDLKIYLNKPHADSKDLPAGIKRGVKNMKRQIRATYTYQLAENPDEADYTLETQADWFDTPTKTIPAIVYKVKMYDKSNNLIYQWNEVVKKADQSQNWI